MPRKNEDRMDGVAVNHDNDDERSSNRYIDPEKDGR
jgi:hypothetical protein